MEKCEESAYVGLAVPHCITQHTAFERVCLDPWVLQTEYANIVQYQYDKDQTQFSENEQVKLTL